MGGWIPVLPTRGGHYYSSKFSPLPETRLVNRFCVTAAAPPVSHHLIQRLPERLFSHSRVSPVEPTKNTIAQKKKGIKPFFKLVQVRLNSPRTHSFRFCVLDASVNEFRDLLLTALAVLGIIFDTSVSDLCHCVTPKVVGFFKSVPLVVCVPEGMNVPVPRLTCGPNGLNDVDMITYPYYIVK